ncbi:MAG: type VI secretion system baseplate subunit TssG [Candidatus Zixiibacteriota bacterium]
MATDAGSTGTPVADALAKRTAHFAFLQAMWLLQRAHPGTAPVGYQGPPSDEPVRLRPSLSLAFPPGDIESIKHDPERRPPFELITTFLGIYGAHSPLPSYYAEDLLHRSEEDDPIRAFLDIFNHRLLSLFTRGLLRYRGHLLFMPDGRDEFSWRLFAVSGLGTDELVEGVGVERARLLRFAGIWSHHPASAASIAAVIGTYLGGLPVRVAQCCHRWVYLPKNRRSQLARHACRLGEDAIAGERAPDRTGKFRVAIGPLDIDTYRRFLPGGEELRAVARLARLASGGWLAFDLEIILRGADSPCLGVVLAREGRLGWTTGLFSRPSDDLPVHFRAEAAAA